MALSAVCGPTRLSLGPVAGPFSSRLPCRSVGLPQRRSVRARARGDELFDEGAAQVRRLLERDRKDALGEGQKAEYDLDFDRPAGKPDGNGGSSEASTSNSSAFDEELASMRNPMGKAFRSAPKRDAFGSAARSPFGSDSSGDMWASLEPVADDEDEAWWKQISFGQVAIALSFVLVIGLMLGTVWVTAKLGAIHFNE